MGAPTGGAALFLFALLALRGRRARLGEPKGLRGRLVQGALIMSLAACTSEDPAFPADAGGGRAGRDAGSGADSGGGTAGRDGGSGADSGGGTVGRDGSSDADSGGGTAGRDGSSGADSGGGTAGRDGSSDADSGGGTAGGGGSSGVDSGGGTAGGDAGSDADSGTDEGDGAAKPDAMADGGMDAGMDAGAVAVRQIAAGGDHTCALLTTGAVRCWGLNDYGQLGYGNTNKIGDDETPASAGDVDVGGPVQQIVAGYEQTCALLTNGAVRCWGAGYHYGNTNSIGDDETPASAGDVDVGGSVQQIAAGHGHTCVLLTNGAVRCWGWGGQLGYGNTNTIGDDETPASAGDVNVGGPVQQIAAGGQHTCALLTNGAVRCWGWGGVGLGYGNDNNIGDNEAPASAGDVNVGGGPVQQIAAGTHTCALLTNGAVRCWFRAPPASDVNVGGSVQQVAAGMGHICALLTNGAVRCWGNGHDGQLGYGNTNPIGYDEGPASAGDVPLL